MKKEFAVAVIFLFIGVVLAPPIFADFVETKSFFRTNIIIVDDDGDGDYTRIHDAIENATAGDTIEVYSGTYMETNISVDKQLILQGIDAELGGGGGTGKPFIINTEDDREIIKVTVDGCRISGFHIKSTGWCSEGIQLYQSNNHHVYQNEIDNLNFGIQLWESSNNKVYENEVTESVYAIINSHISHNNQIFDNYMNDNNYGIRISNFAENITVYNNTVRGSNANGIGISRSNNNSIYGNKISSSGHGISLWMEDNAGYGHIVFDNVITSCEIGIYVTGKFHNIYHNNIIICNYGIRMEKIESNPPTHCCANKVYENNIISSGDAGVMLDGVYTSDIYRNIITDSEKIGLKLVKSEINNIFENNITYNDRGIYLYSCEDNIENFE